MKKVIGITGSIGSGKRYAIDTFKKICKERKINAIFSWSANWRKQDKDI